MEAGNGRLSRQPSRFTVGLEPYLQQNALDPGRLLGDSQTMRQKISEYRE
jgi:hypothetical protein